MKVIRVWRGQLLPPSRDGVSLDTVRDAWGRLFTRQHDSYGLVLYLGDHRFFVGITVSRRFE